MLHVIEFQKRGLPPVSYTHLDVYKRQRSGIKPCIVERANVQLTILNQIDFMLLEQVVYTENFIYVQQKLISVENIDFHLSVPFGVLFKRNKDDLAN